MIQSSAYRGAADYQRVRELLIESYAITGRMHNWGIDCWDWFRYCGKVFEEIASARGWEKDVRLWETSAGKLVGAVIPDDGGEVNLQIHPHYRGIEEEMLAWAERQHKMTRPSGVDRWPLNLYVYEFDQERQTLLKDRGYENLGHDSYMRWRSLGDPIPKERLPEGYCVRNIDGGDREDLEKRAAVANNAFDINKHTAETIKMLQNAPTYRPEGDLVVVAPEGTFAAYGVIWFDDANEVGMFGPVGTHRAYRHRGLAKAIMIEGLRRLVALKATVAYVDCGLDASANSLYESVGFTDFERVFHWRKEF
jgi:mycothiol synthase